METWQDSFALPKAEKEQGKAAVPMAIAFEASALSKRLLKRCKGRRDCVSGCQIPRSERETELVASLICFHVSLPANCSLLLVVTTITTVQCTKEVFFLILDGSIVVFRCAGIIRIFSPQNCSNPDGRVKEQWKEKWSEPWHSARRPWLTPTGSCASDETEGEEEKPIRAPPGLSDPNGEDDKRRDSRHELHGCQSGATANAENRVLPHEGREAVREDPSRTNKRQAEGSDAPLCFELVALSTTKLVVQCALAIVART